MNKNARTGKVEMSMDEYLEACENLEEIKQENEELKATIKSWENSHCEECKGGLSR